MGYRKLLKQYMHHLKDVTGSDLVELAALTNALTEREIGELRSIAAELRRESYEAADATDYNHVVRKMLREGAIELGQLDKLRGIELGPENEQMPEEQFRHILLTLLQTPGEATNRNNARQ